MNVKYPLLQSDEEKQTTQRVSEKKMQPKVVETLQKYEQEIMFLKFNRLINDQKLPMKNIAFLLILD